MEHEPVLFNEVMEYLAPAPGDIVVEGTVNGGGHAAGIIDRFLPNGRFIGIDLDASLLERTRERFSNLGSAEFVHANYADLPDVLAERNVPGIDGLLLDLGFSSAHLSSGRGFSFEDEGMLSMTYDEQASSVREVISGMSVT